MATACLVLPHMGRAQIEQNVAQQVIETLAQKDPANRQGIEKGVTQTAALWRDSDGSAPDFVAFCTENYLADPAVKEQVFLKISDYMEQISGHFNEMSLQLQHNLHQPTGAVLPIDERFGSYSPSTHLQSDFYNNKIAFITTLNFPYYNLSEKEALGNDRKAWAYARLGDSFTERIPASAYQAAGQANSDADIYISVYNIYMGQVTNRKGELLFPSESVLLSHWNLRDEIKANYNKGKTGTDKQRTVYEVMKRIISQEIPTEVINSGELVWNPYSNTVTKNGSLQTATPEDTVRYQKMLNNFQALRTIDQYTGNTYIDRKFNDGMEVALTDVETLFDAFLSAPELKAVGAKIAKQAGRKLEAYDIWYDGFKARSMLNEAVLDTLTRSRYPNAEALDDDLPNLLEKAGFSADRANYLAEKIKVDAARGSGHAWGAAMKGQQSRLRTRIPDSGMDYKGYNIAIHEFGHNVEQTLSLYDVDYFMLNGVPNTAFTEALAFVFQKRDLELLGMTDNNPEKASLDVLDKVWSLYEIAGVSMLDIAVWKWLYAHPEATASELKTAIIELAKEVWNRYYAPVFGVKDETILAVYSHMISYPLYLSAYAFGQIIEFQLDQYLQEKDFATEVERIYKQGRLTPNAWMIGATGSPLSVAPILEATRKVLDAK